MTDKMRWRYGDTNPVVAAVDSSTVIEIGDLVRQDTNDAKPASSLTDQGSETANQDAFTDTFLGVAMQRSRAGDTDPIRVATTGVFELDCPSGTFELGDTKYELHLSTANQLFGQRGYEFEKESDPLSTGVELTNHAYFVQQQVTVKNRW